MNHLIFHTQWNHIIFPGTDLCLQCYQPKVSESLLVTTKAIPNRLATCFINCQTENVDPVGQKKKKKKGMVKMTK